MPRQAPEDEARARGSVVIPAHNEETTILGVLRPLAGCAVSKQVEVIVAANGCTDKTVDLARSVPGVIVIDIESPSKVAAINAADAVASVWPRLYLDADVQLSADGVLAVFDRLAVGDVVAARPRFVYATGEANALVRAYYRARLRMPSMSEHLWGAGAYALSEAAHARFTTFPSVTADDLFVDSLFYPDDMVVVDCDPVRVNTPRRSAALVRVLTRVYQGKREIAADGRQTTGWVSAGGLRVLVRSVRSLSHARDAVVYGGFAITAKLVSVRRPSQWQRDDSSREVSVSGSTTQVDAHGNGVA